MSKVAILTDQHFGFKRQSTIFHDYFLKFYNDVFFPFLEENNISTVIDLGDTFDSRKTLDLTTIDWAKRNYYDRLEALNCQVHTIVGNHTTYYRNTNRINTPELLLNQYPNIQTYSGATEIQLNDLSVLLIPWINQENEKDTLKLIENTKATVAMGHLELNGFYVNRGTQMEGGKDPDVFSKFKKVFTGHFHTRSDNGTIYYIGNPYEMFFSDVGDPRGFIIFDTDTLKHSYVNNPNHLFDVSDLKIIENYSVSEDSEEFDADLESEDTFSLIQRFVEESDVNLNKDKLKLVLSELHKEACELI